MGHKEVVIQIARISCDMLKSLVGLKQQKKRVVV